MTPEVERERLPENMKGTFDDLNDFIVEYINHHNCIAHHEAELKRLHEEIMPRIILLNNHFTEVMNMPVFDEFMDQLDDEG